MFKHGDLPCWETNAGPALTLRVTGVLQGEVNVGEKGKEGYCSFVDAQDCTIGGESRPLNPPSTTPRFRLVLPTPVLSTK